MEQLQKLKEWLKSEEAGAGETVLMPMVLKKPMFPHAKGRWTWERAEAYMRTNPEHDAWGLLLDGLLAIDCDDEAAVTWLESQGSGDNETRSALERCAVETTRKGRHYLFKRPSWADAEGYLDGARQVTDLAVDVKTRCSTGTRGVLTVAPSPEKQWLAGRAPWELGELPEVPRALLEKVATSKRRGARRPGPSQAPMGVASFETSGPIEKLLLLLSKTRWQTYGSWRDIATALKNSDGERYRTVWDSLSRTCPNYDAEAARKLWESVCQAGYDGPRLTVRTLEKWAREDDPHGYAMYRASVLSPQFKEKWQAGDRGLGEIASVLLRDTVKCMDDTSGTTCYLYDSATCHWQRVGEKSLKGPASHALDEALGDVNLWLSTELAATDARDETKRKALEEKLTACKACRKYVRTSRGMRQVMDYAMPLLVDETFEQRHLIGLKGGYVVDLRTGEKRRTTPEDMIHVELSVEYDPCASASEWVHEMVKTMMAGDNELACFLQELLGYGITGNVNKEVSPIWTGGGRNGKGLLTQALLKLLGPFYREMKVAIISDSRVCGNPDAERAKLLGARLAVCNELKPNEKLKTDVVQMLTGGDGIPAKALYKNPITIQPRHILILTTNHMPDLCGEVIMAIMERLLVVPFSVTFRDMLPGEKETETLRQVDKSLKDRLKSAEGQSALFAWLVEGAKAWYRAPGTLKRRAPRKVREHTANFLEGQDRVKTFLEDQCEFGEDMRVSSQAFFFRYRDTTQHPCVVDTWFYDKLAEKGFKKKKIRVKSQSRSVQGFEGIALKVVPLDDDETDELRQ